MPAPTHDASARSTTRGARRNRCPDRRPARFSAITRLPLLHRRQCRRAARMLRVSPLRQLQLESAIAAIGFLVTFRIKRLKFAKTGGNEALGRHPLGDQILHHRDRARRRQRPVRGELRGNDRPHISMSVDPEHPGDFLWYLLLEIKEGDCEFIKLAAPFGVEDRRAGIEEEFGLEYEPVAHDSDVGSRPEYLPQLAEKVGAIAR